MSGLKCVHVRLTLGRSGLCRYFDQKRMSPLHKVRQGAVCRWITVCSSCSGALSLGSSVCQDGPAEPLEYTTLRLRVRVRSEEPRDTDTYRQEPRIPNTLTLKTALTDPMNVELCAQQRNTEEAPNTPVVCCTSDIT